LQGRVLHGQAQQVRVKQHDRTQAPVGALGERAANVLPGIVADLVTYGRLERCELRVGGGRGGRNAEPLVGLAERTRDVRGLGRLGHAEEKRARGLVVYAILGRLARAEPPVVDERRKPEAEDEPVDGEHPDVVLRLDDPRW
jgi:hypothetical protein